MTFVFLVFISRPAYEARSNRSVSVLSTTLVVDANAMSSAYASTISGPSRLSSTMTRGLHPRGDDAPLWRAFVRQNIYNISNRNVFHF